MFDGPFARWDACSGDCMPLDEFNATVYGKNVLQVGEKRKNAPKIASRQTVWSVRKLLSKRVQLERKAHPLKNTMKDNENIFSLSHSEPLDPSGAAQSAQNKHPVNCINTTQITTGPSLNLQCHCHRTVGTHTQHCKFAHVSTREPR